MSFDITGLGSVFDFGSKIIDKIFPDKDAADKAKIRLLELQQAGEFKEMELAAQNAVEQIKVNAEEAKSSSVLVSGWRPAAGWVCVGGLGYMTLFRPIMSWIATIFTWVQYRR